jgi:hypothetical protein
MSEEAVRTEASSPARAGEAAVSELCRREGIHPTIYYISSDAGRVKMLLLLPFFFVGHTSPLGHTRPFRGECLRTTVGLSHPCPTYVLGPLSFIASVLATRHLFGHWGP